jgi:hypothetical protein
MPFMHSIDEMGGTFLIAGRESMNWTERKPKHMLLLLVGVCEWEAKSGLPAESELLII